MSNYKSGIVKAIQWHYGRVKLGFFRGDKAKAEKDGKTHQFWLVLAPSRNNKTPKTGEKWDGDFFKGGDKLQNAAGDLVDTYYQEDSLDGHQDLNPNEAPITKIIPKEDIPEFKTDSDLVAIKMVALAWDMTKGKDELTYDESMSFIKSAMGELMK